MGHCPRKGPPRWLWEACNQDFNPRALSPPVVSGILKDCYHTVKAEPVHLAIDIALHESAESSTSTYVGGPLWLLWQWVPLVNSLLGEEAFPFISPESSNIGCPQVPTIRERRGRELFYIHSILSLQVSRPDGALVWSTDVVLITKILRDVDCGAIVEALSNLGEQHPPMKLFHDNILYLHLVWSVKMNILQVHFSAWKKWSLNFYS